MIIEIRGTGSQNKGAELMTHAILQHFTSHPSNLDAKFVVGPKFGPYTKRAQLGLYIKQHSPRLGWTRLAQALMPDHYRRTLGIIKPSEIDVVLDASGFAFGDQWSPNRTERLAEEAKKWKRNPTQKLILLPQAFGPFSTDRIKKAFLEVQEYADLIYARDQESYDYVCELNGPVERLRLMPDFTIITEGKVPSHYKPSTRDMLIVPNVRMLDRTTSNVQAGYVPFLIQCIHEAIQRELRPVVLLHSAEDKEILSELEKASTDLLVLHEDNPLHLKGILGTAYLVIASRYHAIISALSQGVPVLGTGWSHKYRLLFDDFGCAELLVSLEDSDAVSGLFDQICSEESRVTVIDTIKARGEALKQQVYKMWREIDSTIGL
jgi:hypothetical protein